MNYMDFIDISRNWKGKVCIFGAGKMGSGDAFDLIHEYAKMPVDYYCDNYKVGETINGIEVKSPAFLYKNCDDTLCFVAVAKEIASEILQQLEINNVKNVFYIGELFENGNPIWQIAEYIDGHCDVELKEQYKDLMDDKLFISVEFKKKLGYEMDWDMPKTLNQKIQWLKVNDRKPLYTQLADKYGVRSYIKERFGEEYLIPLLFKTSNYRDINEKTIPNVHCIVKSTAASGDTTIIRKKEYVNWESLQMKYKKVLESNYYYYDREWCYKNISPQIIVEQLLEQKDGKIPNDYKLHFFNGVCRFVYCTIDREGLNYRKMYTPSWEELKFAWRGNVKDLSLIEGPSIQKPSTFEDMLRIGSEIAKNMPYVRVDFYDVDGKLYCGEITLYHGGGTNPFYPREYDWYFGGMLMLEGAV